MEQGQGEAKDGQNCFKSSNQRQKENWIEVEGKRIQIREVWESGDELLLIVVNGNPGFVMKLPGTIGNRGKSEEIRGCWNLLMNTL